MENDTREVLKDSIRNILKACREDLDGLIQVGFMMMAEDKDFRTVVMEILKTIATHKND